MVRRTILGALVLAAAFFSTPAHADAGHDRISLGEVSVAAGDSSRPRVNADEVRVAAASALDGIDLSAVPAGKHAIVSVSVVRLEPSANRNGIECVVSAAVRDAQQGKLIALLESRTRSEAGTPTAQVAKAAMTSAVRGAMSQLPTALAGTPAQ